VKTQDLLLEIGTEEMPAGFMPQALKDLSRLAAEYLEAARLSYEKISSLGTPRRLTLAVGGLADFQPDREEFLTGPPARVAFAPGGSPTKAGEGFARSQGVSVADLTVEDTERGPYVVLRRTVPGRRTSELLREILPAVITSIPFAKTMRWGMEELRFARPIRWLLAIYGGDVVPFTLAGVTTGRESRGHRFMAPRAIECPSELGGYRSALEKGFVLVDPEARRTRLLEGAERAAAAVGGRLLRDEDLVEINTHLTEFPSAVCGSFQERFLSLPREVLVTSMKEHQKYFAVVDDSGRLMPHFVAINNTRSPRPELVRKGHERVLTARLSDAAFFFEEDRRRPLEAFVPELSGMVFHQRLGTLYDKTLRVRALARHLAQEITPDDIAVVERAAYLSKADLLTAMVGEFPGLQGVMGREYALLSGEEPSVARAIEEHYLPVRSGGGLPETVGGALLGIADKMDTICGTFAIGLQPSGTADPYALRRLSLGVLHILEVRALPLSLPTLVAEALKPYKDFISETSDDLAGSVMGFFRGRFVNDLAARGSAQDCVEAAVNAGFDVVADCVRRVEALTAMRSRPEFEPLSVAFRRVMNILKGFKGGAIDPALLRDDEEKALYAAYTSIRDRVTSLLGAGDYENGLAGLLALKPQVDRFFDHVMVMVDDIALRDNRLALLWHISRLFLRIGDLSAIVVKV
jgi:glycyl-tRNA synthetase beta chain